MAAVEQVLIDVKVNADTAAQKLADTKKRIEELKNEQKNLQLEFKNGGAASAEMAAKFATNDAQLKQLTAQEKMYSAQINIAAEGGKKYGDSLTEQAQLLTQLKKEYSSLSAEQKKSEGGAAMLKQIKEIDDAVKGTSEEMGEYQRSVGHYQLALEGLGGKGMEVASLFKGGFKSAMSAAGEAVVNFGKMLLTTPIGWIAALVGVLIAAFQKLKEAFGKNEEASDALKAAMSTFKPILTAINTVFVSLAKVVAEVVTQIVKAASAVLNLIPGFKEASAAAKELAEAQDELQHKERDYAVANAENEKKISENNARIANKAKESAATRVKLLKENAKLEKENAVRNTALAKIAYENAVKQARQEKDTGEETKKRIAELKVAYLQAQAGFSDAMVSINKRTSQAIKQIRMDEESAAQEHDKMLKERAEKTQQALSTEMSEQRTAESIAIQLIKDEGERSRAAIQNNYDNQIKDLKKKLKEESNLTKKAKEAINAQIVGLEKVRENELKNLSDEELQKRLTNEIAIQTQIQELRLQKTNDLQAQEIAAVEKETEAKKDALYAQYDELKDSEIDAKKQIDEALELLEERASEKRREIKKKYAEKSARDEYNIAVQSIKRQYDALVSEVGDNEAKVAKLREEEAQTNYNNLLNLDKTAKAALFANEEAYVDAVNEAESKVQQARKTSTEAQKSQIETIGSTMHALTSSMSDMFKAVAGDSESYEKFKKAMAIADAAISLGQAIASAVASSTAGDPYTLAIRVATNVASVVAAFASLVASISSATIPSASSFAEGGIVPGNSTTGDKISANVNSREMILTMQDQQNLLSLIRAGVPSYSFDYQILADAVKSAVSSIPSPVLDYSEFTKFTDRVKMTEKMVRI